MNVTTESLGSHPFFPLDAALGVYEPNTIGSLLLVGYFVAGSIAIMSTAYTIINLMKPGVPACRMATALWFTLSGSIHLFFEGYYSVNFHQMASRTDLFGQLWKEYALSDSRYLTQDSFVMTMESVTAFLWGPLCFVTVYCIINSHPMRHPLQLIISCGQVYGDILYYATYSFDIYVFGVRSCRPEDFYFWAYYFFCNFIWIVIPGLLIVSSVKTISSAIDKVQSAEKVKKTL